MLIRTKDGAGYELPAESADAFARIYRDGARELDRMLIWLEIHPGRRPATAKSAPRFLANWFRRVQKVEIGRLAAREEQRSERSRIIDLITGADYGHGSGNGDAGAETVVSEDGRILDGRGGRQSAAGSPPW